MLLVPVRIRLLIHGSIQKNYAAVEVKSIPRQPPDAAHLGNQPRMLCLLIASPAARIIFAAGRIARTLADRRIAVLRFDFTGIGASKGEFANAGFSANVADLVAAADHLRRTHRAPALLIGHSLGGAAVLAAATEVPEASAVVTIAAPADPVHATHLFKDRIPEINLKGEAEVVLAGRPFRVRREFLDDLAGQNLAERIGRLRKALLVLHAPNDKTVGIDHANRIFTVAKHPKSFISLGGADHLLSGKSDAAYVGHVIAAWAQRYLDHAMSVQPTADAAISTDPGSAVVSENGRGALQRDVGDRSPSADCR
jgi:putative redox protein